MRWKGLTCLGLVAMSLAAGCAEAPTPLEIAAPGPTPEVRQAELDTSFRVAVPESCNQVFCYGAGGARPLHTVAMDEMAFAIVLDMEASEGFDSAVDWEVTCQAPDDEDPACLRALGRGRDRLPLHLEFMDLRLMPGTVLSLLLAAPTVGDPVADMALGETRGPSHVTGRVDAIFLSPELRPAFEFRRLPVAWESDSGPCALLVDPDCATAPGAYYRWETLEGTVVAADLTLTWSSTTLADEVFRLILGPGGGMVEGRSPLRIQSDGLDLGDNPYVLIYHGDPTGLDPTGLAFVYTGTKTPFRLEGSLTVRVLPPIEGAA